MQVKLSNALRAAQSAHPWFIVLIVKDKSGRSVEVYATHVWTDLLRKSLIAVRQAHNLRKQLNKSWLHVSFEDRLVDDKLVDWMQETVREVGRDYTHQKSQLFKTLGFEDGNGFGEIKIETTSLADLARNVLGLGNGLGVKQFTFTEARFGISDQKPKIDVFGGIARITPNPVARCELRIRGALPFEPIILTGEAFAFNLPGLTVLHRKLRLSTRFFEIIWSEDGASECEVTLDLTVSHELETLEKFARISFWSEKGPLDVQVWIDGKRALGGALRMRRDVGSSWGDLAKALKLLCSIARPEHGRILQMTVDDVARSPGLRTLQEVADSESVRVEFESASLETGGITSLLYYYRIEVGQHLFCALAERDVRQDITTDEHRQITASSERFIDTYALSAAKDSDREMIRLDYERELAKRGGNAGVIGLGNLYDFLMDSVNSSNIEPSVPAVLR